MIKTVQNSKLFLVSCSHFMIDMYPPFFALYIVLADMDLAKAGLISSLASLLSNGLQPFFGFWADRWRGKTMVLVALVVAPLFISLIGTTTNLYVLGFFFIIGCLAVSLFHPAASSIVHAVGGDTKHSAFSLFIFVGTLGYSLGQYVFTGCDALMGVQYSYLLCLPALVFAGLYAWYGPAMPASQTTHNVQHMAAMIRENWRPLVILYLLVVIRGGVQVGFNFSLPKLLYALGYSKAVWAGGALLIFNFAGAILMLVAGYLADTWKAKLIMVLSMAMATPCLIIFLMLGTSHPVISLVALGLGGGVLLASNPVGVVLGQNLMPQAEATTSSLLMGFGWAVGSVTPYIIGYFSKEAGVFSTEKLIASLLVLSLVPLAGGVLAMFLPGDKKYRKSEG
jgi:FSR family fosmidomycin resistance protein-like MFS transporter